MPLISPPTLLAAYLSQTPPTRPSNRTPTQCRPIHLNTSSLTHCNGSSLLKLGESTIVCGIRAEILPVSEIAHYRASETARNSAREEQDTDGGHEAIALNNLLVPNLELSTNCHPSYPANVAPSITAQSISQRVLSLLHSSRLIRVSDLEVRHTSTASASGIDPDDAAYVEPEKDVLKAYWTLYIDCVCLSFGGVGGVFDTTVMAIVAALKDLRLPAARWDEDDKRILCDADMKNTRALTLNGLPCPLNFGIFDPSLAAGQRARVGRPATVKGNGTIVLLDTDSFEDDVCQETGSVVVDCSSGGCKLLRIEKAGGNGALGVAALKDVVAHAETRWTEWKSVLEASGG